MRSSEAVGWLIDYTGSLEDTLAMAWTLASDGEAGLPRRDVEGAGLSSVPTDAPGLPAADGDVGRAARKAMVDCIQGACGATLSEALELQARHSGSFMTSKACKKGEIGAQYTKTMVVSDGRKAGRYVDLGLKGKGAIVTGGGLGIGAGIAKVLAREGCNVAIVDLREDDEVQDVLAEVEGQGVQGLAIQADVSVHADADAVVSRVVEEFGRLDIMVCNAGITRDGVIWKMTEKQWDQVMGVNLKGYFNYNQAAARHFKEMKYGKIVNISSINGMRGKFAQANYAASKGGVIALSKSLAKELGRFNVNVNVVAPGMVLTEMMESPGRRVQSRRHGRDCPGALCHTP